MLNQGVWTELEIKIYCGQKAVDKFRKLSMIGFSMECVTAEFLQFFKEKRENLAFGWTAAYSPSNSNISGIFLKFPNF